MISLMDLYDGWEFDLLKVEDFLRRELEGEVLGNESGRRDVLEDECEFSLEVLKILRNSENGLLNKYKGYPVELNDHKFLFLFAGSVNDALVVFLKGVI